MDKWLRRQSSKQQKQKSEQQTQQKRKNEQQTQQQLKEEQDLQHALEESRLANDIEKAIALSLMDQQQEQRTSLPSSSTPIQSGSVKRSGSTSSVKSNRYDFHKTSATLSSTTTPTQNASSDTWDVEVFLNNLLYPPTTEPSDTNFSEDSANLDRLSLSSGMYDLGDDDDEDATTDEEDSQHANPPMTDKGAAMYNLGDNDDKNTTDNQQQKTTNPSMDNDNTTAQPTSDDDDWEIVDDPEAETLSSPGGSSPQGKQRWHDEQAEDQFFGQFRRETWDTAHIRSTYDAMKKRSIATVIKKNKKQKTNSSRGSNDHNYYTMADDVLEEAFDAAGFGESAAGLSWEGVGQSRYA